LSKTFTKCDIAESKEYKKEYAEKKNPYKRILLDWETSVLQETLHTLALYPFCASHISAF
jgi:hypothetical protein